jgi:hypothetical protein
VEMKKWRIQSKWLKECAVRSLPNEKHMHLSDGMTFTSFSSISTGRQWYRKIGNIFWRYGQQKITCQRCIHVESRIGLLLHYLTRSWGNQYSGAGKHSSNLTFCNSRMFQTEVILNKIGSGQIFFENNRMSTKNGMNFIFLIFNICHAGFLESDAMRHGVAMFTDMTKTTNNNELLIVLQTTRLYRINHRRRQDCA